MIAYHEKLNDLLNANVPFVSVTVVDTIGSVPQDAGSKMLVTSEGLFYGTVGGGKVEARAIKEAQRLLSEKQIAVLSEDSRHLHRSSTHFVNWSLEKDIGMTCGGSVKIYFETFNTNLWNICIFGAGHCANALIHILINLDCRITCYDPRAEWIDKLPESPKLKKVLTDDMPSKSHDLPENAFVLLITMGHSTDGPILTEILRNWHLRQFPYVGVIGSKAKSVRLKKDIQSAGLPAPLQDVFHCPIGLSLGSNHPQEIAISIAAQLLQVRDQLELAPERVANCLAEESQNEE